MNLDPSLSPAQPDEEVHIKPSLEAAYERGEISMAEARQLSGQVVVEHEIAFPDVTEKDGEKDSFTGQPPRHDRDSASLRVRDEGEARRRQGIVPPEHQRI